MIFRRKKQKHRYIMEIRSARTLRLIDSKIIEDRKQYRKTCDKLTKIIRLCMEISQEDELLMRVKENSYLVRNGKKYGYVVGLIPIKH